MCGVYRMGIILGGSPHTAARPPRPTTRQWDGGPGGCGRAVEPQSPNLAGYALDASKKVLWRVGAVVRVALWGCLAGQVLAHPLWFPSKEGSPASYKTGRK